MFSFSSNSKSKKYGCEVEVDITGSDCWVTVDGVKYGTETNKEKEKSNTTFSTSQNNAGMNSESSKNNRWQQNEREKEKSLPKSWKSHHNVGGVHIGGHNCGTITLDGNVYNTSESSQKPDKCRNIGGYNRRGDNNDDIQREDIDDHHHVGGVHLGGRDYGVINDDGKNPESHINKEEEKTTFTNDKNDGEKDKFSDKTKNNWGQQNEKEESLPKTMKSHHNSGGVHIGGSNYGTITVTGNKNESSKNSQKPDKYGNIGGYHLRGDNNDDIHYDGSH